jgi:hypothetical protein
MKVLNGFIKSIEWWKLIPSGLNGMKNLVIAGGGVDTLNDYVTAACTRNGNLFIAYVPPAHTGSITIDITALSGNSTASWFDPTNGTYHTIPTDVVPSAVKCEFKTPGKNNAGDNDWVLVIRKKIKK